MADDLWLVRILNGDRVTVNASNEEEALSRALQLIRLKAHRITGTSLTVKKSGGD